MALSDDDVREILRIIDETDLSELRVETAEFSLHVTKGRPAEELTSPPPRISASRTQEVGSSAENAAPQNGLLTIDAPMLGTFYRADGPGKPPFVDVGSEVQPDTIVCIIEVMKMMNSVPAGVSGTVVEVCHENAELVEFGTPMFRVRPG
jgi:acetyl-CoA carboxylase biotin carboxyl carrier protein